VPITVSFYYSEIQLRCYYAHVATKNDLSPSQLLSFKHSKIARITLLHMDVYQNIEVFYILRENMLSKSLSKIFHLINRVEINKLRIKNQYPTVV